MNGRTVVLKQPHGVVLLREKDGASERMRSIVELRNGGHGTFTRQHLLQGTHRDHERDIGLPVAGHVGAAISKGRRVDGELQRPACIASANITHQDVVVQRFRRVFRFSFLQIFTSPEAGSSGTGRIGSTLFKPMASGSA